MMAMARLDIPSVFVYGGSILPGHWKGEDIQIQTVFEAVGQIQAGQIDEDELYGIESNACPGPGSCGGMFTANTMSSIGEALGLSIPGAASEHKRRPAQACILTPSRYRRDEPAT